jgi:hypothetical protein
VINIPLIPILSILANQWLHLIKRKIVYTSLATAYI